MAYVNIALISMDLQLLQLMIAHKYAEMAS